MCNQCAAKVKEQNNDILLVCKLKQSIIKIIKALNLSFEQFRKEI